ncbi:MAG TPA: VOC family protein [Sphingomicrobium sp.]|jgi:predicted enzyme related to lactoylglutathione lyase
MPSFILNIDVPDLESGIAFYTAAFDLEVGRRFGSGFVELLGAETAIYLLQKQAGTPASPTVSDVRRYERHWSPIHLDFVVEDIEVAIAKVRAAGAIQEGETCEAAYGHLATFADPFGHGFCLIQFNSTGYDALLETN